MAQINTNNREEKPYTHTLLAKVTIFLLKYAAQFKQRNWNVLDIGNHAKTRGCCTRPLVSRVYLLFNESFSHIVFDETPQWQRKD